MKLYCMRHAEADTSLINQDPPLSDKGRNDLICLAKHLKACHIAPEQIMHSPKLRAIQTLEILVDILKVKHTRSKVELDTQSSIMDLQAEIALCQSDTMLIGHLPYMSRLVNYLVFNKEQHSVINFAPGAVVCLHAAEAANSHWVIDWLLCPHIVCSSIIH